MIPKIVCDKLIKNIRSYSSAVFIGGFTILLSHLLYYTSYPWRSYCQLEGILLAFLVPLSGYFVLYYQEIFPKTSDAPLQPEKDL